MPTATGSINLMPQLNAKNYVDTAIDNLEIGGTNLLGNTANLDIVSIGGNSAASTFGDITGYNTGYTLFSREDYDGYSNALTWTESATGNRGVSWYTKPGVIKADETYIFSCFIKTSSATNAHMHTAWRNAASNATYVGWKSEGSTAIPANTWTKYICIFTPDSNAYLDWELLTALCFTGVSSGSTYWIAHAKLEKGNKATDWSPAPEDAELIFKSELNSSRVWYANCASANNAAKEATIVPSTTDFVLATGTIVYVKFTTTNSLAVASLTLNVNGTGAKPIKRYGTTNLAAVGNITAGMVCQFVYDGTNWMWVGHIDTNTNTVSQTRWQNILVAADIITAGHIICGTSAGYRNIAAGVSFDLAYPLLYAGTNIAKGATSGTRDNNFLQINGINAANNVNVQSAAVGSIIYLKGTVSDNIFTIASSNFLTCAIPTSVDGFCYIPIGIIYSGSSIYFNSSKDLYAYVDGAFGPVSIREASAASKTATTYITHVDDNGITIHPKNATNNVYPNRVGINANGMNVYKDNVSVGSYGDTTRIGKDDESHVFLDYHSMQLVDQEGQTYFYVSDLRDSTGKVLVEDTLDVDSPSKYVFVTSYSIFSVLNVYIYDPDSDTTINVPNESEVNNSEDIYYKIQQSSLIAFYLNNVSYPVAFSGQYVIVEYYTKSREIKAFTFGSRANGRIGPGSFAFGYLVDAEGRYSHAEGDQTNAYGAYSHAEGDGSAALGTASHAEGANSHANGHYSHAEGTATWAVGAGSHAQNIGTRAHSEGQTAIGKFNLEDASNVYAFIIGNGADDSNRSNALTVDWSGNVQPAGDINATGHYLKLNSTNLTLDTSNHYGDSRIRFYNDSDDTYGEIVPAMLTSGTTLMRLACTNPSASVTNYIEVRVTSAGDKTYYVSDQANFRSAIGLSRTDTNLTLSGTSAGAVHMVRNETTVTIFINGIKLSAALAAGSFVTIATVPSDYRPAYDAYVSVYAPTNGYPHGVIGLVNTSGNVRIGNRSSAQLAANSHTWSGIITYVI